MHTASWNEQCQLNLYPNKKPITHLYSPYLQILFGLKNHLKNSGLHCAPQKYKVNSKISIQILLKEQRFQWMVRQQSSLNYVKNHYYKLQREYNKLRKFKHRQYKQTLINQLDSLHDNNPKLY